MKPSSRWFRVTTPFWVLLAGCVSPQPDLEAVADLYIQAVQQRDVERLLELSSAEAGPGDRRQALEERYADYLAGRDAGRLDFRDDGIVLIKALNLGNGAYYRTVEAGVSGPGRTYLVQEVRLAYQSIDISQLPVGTTIYLLGEPLGSVYRPVIGRREQDVRRLLETVWVRWEFTRVEAGWRVRSLGPDAARPPVSYDDTTRF